MTSMSRSEKADQTSKAICWSIATALFLAVIKFVTAMTTHSMSVMASALDSMLDVASSSINLIASKKAAEPPDENHAYGHEKIESLASLFQSLLIGGSGIALVAESGKRLIRGTALHDIPLGMGVMLLSLLLTLALTFRLTAGQKQNNSLILKTEKAHYTMDIVTNLGTLIILGVVKWSGNGYWDLLFSIFIAGYIFKTAYGILKQAVDELLDRSLPPVSKESIEHIIRNFNPAIVGFHNFRSRRVADQIFMDFHIEIKGEKEFTKAHDMTESLIARILQDYPGADITVHYDPEGGV